MNVNEWICFFLLVHDKAFYLFSQPTATTINNSTNNDHNKSSYDQRTKQAHEKLISNLNSARPPFLPTNKYSTQRIYTNPLQSLTTNNNDSSSRVREKKKPNVEMHEN